MAQYISVKIQGKVDKLNQWLLLIIYDYVYDYNFTFQLLPCYIAFAKAIDYWKGHFLLRNIQTTYRVMAG